VLSGVSRVGGPWPLPGVGGAVSGWLLGCVVAAFRNGLLGGAAGAAAGAYSGWLLSPDEPINYILAGVAGAALGACLGDWRKLPAPPGSGQGPPTRDTPDNTEEES
jgi:hypothetical protein